MVETLPNEKLGGVSSKEAFFRWAAVGLVVASVLVGTQAASLGGLAGLLQVGENSGLQSMITEQLGEIPLTQGVGHDGQIFYAIGLDLDGNEVSELVDHAAYRYRRILYPLAASVFGLLDGWALLWGMVVLGGLSMAISAGVVASMATRVGKTEYLALAVVLNPGVWLSVRLLTSDVFALALILGALYVFTQQRHTKAASVFALSGLAKDVALATPIPLGGQWRSWKMILIPAGALSLWVLLLSLRFGEGFSSRGNLDWPFQGMLDATAVWPTLGPSELTYIGFALASVVAGIVFSFRRTWLRLPIVAWTALAILSSDWVWNLGNNAARVFAPLPILVALSCCYDSPAEVGDRPS